MPAPHTGRRTLPNKETTVKIARTILAATAAATVLAGAYALPAGATPYTGAPYIKAGQTVTVVNKSPHISPETLDLAIAAWNEAPDPAFTLTEGDRCATNGKPQCIEIVSSDTCGAYSYVGWFMCGVPATKIAKVYVNQGQQPGVTIPGPATVNDTATGAPTGSTTINVLANDTLAKGAAAASLRLVGPSGPATTLTTSDGTWDVTMIGGVPQLRFRPAATFSGKQTAVTYRVTDSNGKTGEATATFVFDRTPAKPAARVAAGTATSGGVAVVHLRDAVTFDADATYTSFRLVDRAGNPAEAVTTAQGAWSIAGMEGDVSYSAMFTPAPGFTGTATIGYEVTDTYANTSRSTVAVTVEAAAARKGPTVVAPIPTTVIEYGTSATIDLLDGVEFSDGVTYSSFEIASPDGYLVSTVTTGQGTWRVTGGHYATFTPADGYVGNSTLGYRMNTSSGEILNSRLNVDVAAPSMARYNEPRTRKPQQRKVEQRKTHPKKAAGRGPQFPAAPALATSTATSQDILNAKALAHEIGHIAGLDHPAIDGTQYFVSTGLVRGASCVATKDAAGKTVLADTIMQPLMNCIPGSDIRLGSYDLADLQGMYPGYYR